MDLRQIPQQFLAQFRALPPRGRLLVGGAVLATAAIIAALSLSGGTLDWAPLFTGLSSEDAGAIVDKLNEQRIPYRLGRGGEVVEVPRDRVAETRIALATQGLPRGGGVGFEILEKQPLGVSEFNQRAQYHRALQGELERSIASIQAVQRARVHLVVPEKQLFRPAEQQASASVVLQLRPGRQLLPNQVQGIVHLVASSVEGLQPERVTVVDQRGDVLSHRTGAEATQSAVLSVQREIEQTAAKRAQDLLEKTLGRGHAAVQVSAQLDASHVERTDETFNPEQQVVRSEQEIDDVVSAVGEASAEGVAGARANLPGGPPPQVSGQGGSRRRTQTRNFEIGKVTSKVTQPVARLQRLTVAVLVDGTYKGDGGARQFVPRPKEELEAYSAIVKEAVGFDERRGDQVEVRCVPFAPVEETVELSSAPPATPPWAYAALAAAVLGLGLAAVVFGRRRSAQVLPPGLLPTSVGQLQASLLGETQGRSQTPAEALGPSPQVARQRAVEALHHHPERAVHILRAWLNETESNEHDEQRALEPHRT